MTSFLWVIPKVLGLIGSVTLKKKSEQEEYGFTALTCTELGIITGNFIGDGKKKNLSVLYMLQMCFTCAIGIGTLHY